MSKSTTHFAYKISIGFGILDIMMVDNALNIAYVLSAVVVVQAEPSFFANQIKLLFVLENSIVNFRLLEDFVNLESILNFLRQTIDYGQMKLFGCRG